MGWFLFWILCAVVAAMIGRKDRVGLNFLLGFLFGPFWIIFILLFQRNRMACPFCISTIHAEASICPHCQKEIQPSPDIVGSYPKYLGREMTESERELFASKQAAERAKAEKKIQRAPEKEKTEGDLVR